MAEGDERTVDEALKHQGQQADRQAREQKTRSDEQ
jgi:hypothetical protein